VDRRCLSEPEMVSRGMVLRADGFWRGSPRPENAICRSSADV
jgi:hypothetical protein